MSNKEEIPRSPEEHLIDGMIEDMLELDIEIAQLEARLRERVDLYDDVRDFHLRFGHPAPDQLVGHAPDQLLEFRIALIQEECRELIHEIRQQRWAGVASEAVDLIYVVIGTLVALGIPLLPFWKDVHRANMTKQPNGQKKPTKPAGWVGPNPQRILRDL